MSLPLATLTGLQWVLAGADQQRRRDAEPGAVAVTVNWWWILGGFLVFVTPLGRMGIAVLCARMLRRFLKPGTYRRGGAGPPACLARRAARRGQRCGEPGRRAVAGVLRPGAGQQGRQGRRPALGAAGDRHAHTGSSQFDRAGGGPDRALDRRRPIPRRNGSPSATTRPSARAHAAPGAVVGKNADVAPGSGVVGKVKKGQYWKGSPAVKSGKARHPWPDHRPRRAPSGWRSTG